MAQATSSKMPQNGFLMQNETKGPVPCKEHQKAKQENG